ncbi:precorrin-4 C(11)-methyltransferase [Anaerosalibacter bizertensis]|uniref:Precorrin-4 C(11)-methyltransferase n=1 Tax=Anaerosalibacter bizertensis TaxID=932217 RepID=A0A844FKB4_9FIRM|nr:precorrin-4 C(11)-methyltransferase [Anaerosalibacter bizertensis]MBV1818589.1 precorrin-4 C(11)-methyltransferase [Bacteroidales bacterium MSK.15.36]HHV26574.1 precorrin-4 C(11)-methyltransferase [Tissierellia bacterium]MBU5293479.1 precorrin-4 C(11)-methyltransferase [Anaerosalibacter bizertensis]MCB5559636.1 precorrin-4 C(11)-methyltransferase [Anaerosalibacter bizertensis]MCG4565577.1 precorrin-4 C(11)-methyltransferase [Anaerosalibacter bizertensis]
MISFVGAGPGDVDLITIKGRKLLEEADIVIYAGSLVSKEHLNFCKEECQFYNSASMTLEEVIDVMEDGLDKGLKVVRLHTGDPTIYGAIREQMDILDEKKISYEVIPGVSSFTAACSAIKKEFTLPEVSQTVILTRIEGRTSVPENEDLEKLASYGASMAIFLSVQQIDNVVDKLKRGYGREDVPIAVVYKATWEDEKIVIGTLKNIGEKVKKEGITKTAQILVGDFISGDYERSKLYDPGFTHEYRKASK